MSNAPIPPEPDWAPPPQAHAPDSRHRAPDPARRVAVRMARWAGVVALITGVTYFGGELSGVAHGPALLAVVLVGAALTVILGRQAWHAGLPAGEVVSAGCLAALLGLGIAFTIAFGACLIALGSH